MSATTQQEQREIFREPVKTEPDIITFAAYELPDPPYPAPPDLVAAIQRTRYVRPITLVRHGSGYRYGDGRRRVAAVRVLIEREKLPEDFPITAQIVRAGPVKTTALSVALNRARAHNVLMEFEAISALLDEDYTERDICRDLSISRMELKRLLTLKNLIPSLYEAFRESRMKATTAFAAAKLPKDSQRELAKNTKGQNKIKGKDVKEVRKVASAALADSLPDIVFLDSEEPVVPAWVSYLHNRVSMLWEHVPSGDDIKDEDDRQLACELRNCLQAAQQSITERYEV